MRGLSVRSLFLNATHIPFAAPLFPSMLEIICWVFRWSHQISLCNVVQLLFLKTKRCCVTLVYAFYTITGINGIGRNIGISCINVMLLKFWCIHRHPEGFWRLKPWCCSWKAWTLWNWWTSLTVVSSLSLAFEVICYHRAGTLWSEEHRLCETPWLNVRTTSIDSLLQWIWKTSFILYSTFTLLMLQISYILVTRGMPLGKS